LVAMNLFRQALKARRKLLSRNFVKRIEPLQGSFPVGSDIEAGDSERKAMQNRFQDRERRKTFYWKVSLHRLESPKMHPASVGCIF
jgi:hypothetical protein